MAVKRMSENVSSKSDKECYNNTHIIERFIGC